MTFADKLIRLRKINGMSQEDLAEELGVSRQAISKWEGMLSVPDLQNVLKISELFNVTTDYLLKDNVGEDRKYCAEREQSCRDGGADEICRTCGQETASEPRVDEDNAEKEAEERTQPRIQTVGVADKSAYEVNRDKNYYVAAGILLLITPALWVFNLFAGKANERAGLPMVLTLISVGTLIVAGILTMLAYRNRKYLGAAFILAALQHISSMTKSLLTSDDLLTLLGTVNGAIMILFCILAAVRVYAKGKTRINKYFVLALPSICGVISVALSVFEYDYSGNSVQTMSFGVGYIAFCLMAAILFREDGYKKKRSENLGLAGIQLLALATALSTLYVVIGMVLVPPGEVITAIYVYGYVVLDVTGLALLPWMAYYTSKKPLGSLKLKRGYIGIAKHILLTSVATLVWHYIWVYRTSEYLNDRTEGKKAGAKEQLIKYILVPFYYIHWFNKHGRVISEIEKQDGEEIGKLNKGMTVFACLMPFVASVVMQNRINAIVPNAESVGCVATETRPE